MLTRCIFWLSTPANFHERAFCPETALSSQLFRFFSISNADWFFCWLGVLKVEDLRSQIFRGRRFSSSHVKKYIDLMNKFEVALQISSHYLLVPSLLPEKQASSMKVSNSPPTELQDCMGDETYFKANVFRRLYRLAYIPSGFWARLITR